MTRTLDNQTETTVFHHDGRGYNEAASAAAKNGRVKMDEIIHRGRTSAEAVVATIQNATVRDKVVKATDVRLVPGDDGRFTIASDYTGANRLHGHAYGQLLADVGFPKTFANSLQKEEGADWVGNLIAHNVNEVLAHRPKQRNLIRIDETDGETAKGWLSDKYRRLDSRPLVDAFMGVCTEYGLLPIEGVASDTKVRVRSVLPVVFEPVPNEVMIFGLEFGNSDYGDGGMVLNLWNMRVWCTNLAVVQKGIRQIHLGRSLPDDIQLSRRTYELDAMTTCSAMRDVAGKIIGPDRINLMLQAVEDASETVIRSQDGIDKLLRGLDKGEAATVRQLYDSPDEVNMPPGQTVYRMSNAVSFFAQNRSIGTDRRLELQELAGKMIVGEQNPKTVREV